MDGEQQTWHRPLGYLAVQWPRIADPYGSTVAVVRRKTAVQKSRKPSTALDRGITYDGRSERIDTARSGGL